MTEADIKRHVAHRQSLADKILRSPSEYKVCDQCRSVSKKSAKTCPICHAYRWDETAEAVIETAKILPTSATPFTSGTVPRL